MKKAEIIFEKGEHKWAVIARDPDKPGFVIDTNEYLVFDGDEAVLLDPGGVEIFPAVFSAICEIYNPHNIRSLFASHQDPDIISSLALWLDFNPKLKCHVSWLWETFVPHFGGNDDTLVGIPDEGARIPFNGHSLEAIPAHYLHSAGNFHCYDPVAKILFTGDVGAALLPEDRQGLFVENFDEHIHFATGFHRRWMGSNEAKERWCRRVKEMDIDMLCPQHGAIYRGEDVSRFIDWFQRLDVGLKE
ncbi:MAG: MBL fold metallo-hydrolase [Gammaproteobacteria bacterium]|nr:MBL fold metallo-hydrolase [Gammaproteobacteria bacterium]